METNNNNTRKSLVAKKRNEDIAAKCLFEEYFDLFEMQPRPVNRAWIEQLAKALFHWAATNEDALIVSQFFLGRGISSSDYYRWLELYPMLKQAHTDALEMIGNRREVGALKKKLSEGIVSYTAAHYNKTCWKAIAEWRSKLTKDENQLQGMRVVQLEKAQDSSLVPLKDDK